LTFQPEEIISMSELSKSMYTLLNSEQKDTL